VENSSSQLEKSINYAGSDMAKNDSDLYEQFRSSSIQAFEYTYELCWKLLTKKLREEFSTPAEVDHMNFKDLIRTAGQKGLVDDVESWFEYREKRNWTSHTYDEQKAEAVFSAAKNFLTDASKLLDKLKS